MFHNDTWPILIFSVPLIAFLSMIWTTAWIFYPPCKTACTASCQTVCDTTCQTVCDTVCEAVCRANTQSLTYVPSFTVQTTVDDWGRVIATLPQDGTRVELKKV
ncbi:hypothetical protein BO86DRAFT_385637 [Aspergillus japonicus CBS 114.51]|uniref:Uncharacterized protein n=1 Tax=Aspergillus japonicus CBS 114.51 TaxID=1448312 RepID=A0A8T8XCS8_ASPJA|nr:hypothetical protein BO86DRAFT_385637 [Aspergillus japonicus CBS 114.51]RAH86073.1 hypothetical protein BO86DRAFT_385637 [Aspergillus japonicus CBS 114.51]